MSGERRRVLLANAGTDQRKETQEEAQFVNARFDEPQAGDHIIMEGDGVVQRGVVSSRTEDTITIGTITGHKGDAPAQGNGYAPTDIGHVQVKRQR